MTYLLYELKNKDPTYLPINVVKKWKTEIN
jgi:hypothetical protein